MHYTVVAFRGLELADNIVNVLPRYKHSSMNESLCEKTMWIKLDMLIYPTLYKELGE